MGEKIRIMRQAEDPPKPVDIMNLFVNFSQQYRNVFMLKIDDEIYIYRALGRSEYREILANANFNDYQKEELICSQCMLYPNPDEYTWDDKPAGLPSEFLKAILKNSFLDNVESRSRLHDYYRAEMYELDNQITCIINEAFPNIDIEEIEQWDVEKTTKYLSRAEWKLHALRGMQFDDGRGVDPSEEILAQRQIQEIQQKENQNNNRRKTIRGGERTSKLTPEKMKEQAEFLRKFPQFANDDVIKSGGIEGLEQADVDDRPPALRPGWG